MIDSGKIICSRQEENRVPWGLGFKPLWFVLIKSKSERYFRTAVGEKEPLLVPEGPNSAVQAPFC